ncbi:MAG: DNA translocase FtsK [Candidatus Omnitrophica bacterium]|nr:DNA translocase FtsK [Candidatus Omnitrophota bacterium]
MTKYANEIFGVLFLGVALICLLSLVSYNPNELLWQTFPPSEPIGNMVGMLGSYLGWASHFLFGKTSYLIPFLLLAWAIGRFIHKPPQPFYMKLFATVCALSTASVVMSLSMFDSVERAVQSGGLVGIVLAKGIVTYTGVLGGIIVLGTLFVLSFFLASEFTVVQILQGTTRFCVGVALLLRQIVAHMAGHMAGVFRRGEVSRRQGRQSPQSASPRISSTYVPSGSGRTSEQNGGEARDRQERPTPTIQIADSPKVTTKVLDRADGLLNKKTQQPPQKKKTSRETKQIRPGEYTLPPLDLLLSPSQDSAGSKVKEDLEHSARVLEDTLRDFGIEVDCVNVDRGPVITRYELQPAPGVKINRITTLSDDIALVMKAASVRVVAPIPGKGLVGVEVPNSKIALVCLREILEDEEFTESPSKLTLALGKDVGGQTVVGDLADMPHLLIAGTTGSGKTVCVNSIITSLLYNTTPDELKFLMVDPKMVELAVFNQLPHLLCPVLTEPKKVTQALEWVVQEMERRYQLLARVGARNINMFNEKVENNTVALDDESGEPIGQLPYIVIIIDELADLMMIAPKEIETTITRLAQLSRAVGIHMILATQRPSVDVVTGVIKANFPARISFKVASKVDSRTVLDINGADKLLGKGDMLFLKPGHFKPIRAQGCLVKDSEIDKVVDFIKAQRDLSYNEEILSAQSTGASSRNIERDELYDEAKRLVIITRQASTSMLQRRLGLGYTRAARIMDALEEEGIVGPFKGNKPREIFVTDFEGNESD